MLTTDLNGYIIKQPIALDPLDRLLLHAESRGRVRAIAGKPMKDKQWLSKNAQALGLNLRVDGCDRLEVLDRVWSRFESGYLEVITGEM